MTAAASIATNLNLPAPVLSMALVQRAVLWLMIASGFVVSIEPAPYEVLFVLTLVVFFAGGMRVSIVFAPLIVFLSLYNIGGFLSVMPIIYDSTARMFVIVSVYMAVTAIFFAMAVLRDPMRILAVMRNAWVFAALIASINGMIGYFNVFGLGEAWAPISRAQGMFKDPNVLSTFLVMPFIFLVQDIVVLRCRWTLLKIPVLVVIAAGLFLAFSRGAWINAIAATGLMIGLSFVLTPSLALRGRIILYAITGVIIFGIMLSVALSIPAVRDIFLIRFSLEQQYDVGETGRFARQFKSLFELVALPNGYGPLQFALRWGEDPHNVFLNAFASYGWLGGFSYMLLIGSTIMGMWQSVFSKTPWQHHSIAVNSVMLTTILQGVQIDTDHWRHFYALLGLSWGLYAATLGWQASQTSAVQSRK
ncbi:MAG: O-antigen ligase domain-containing protein [Anderseniella sp.]|nr:O-antigen ligase domain-containing protein [Anderseniella sp.]